MGILTTKKPTDLAIDKLFIVDILQEHSDRYFMRTHK